MAERLSDRACKIRYLRNRIRNNLKCSGPGMVIAEDGKLLFIRLGRNLIVASPSRVQLAHQQHQLPPTEYKDVSGR